VRKSFVVIIRGEIKTYWEEGNASLYKDLVFLFFQVYIVETSNFLFIHRFIKNSLFKTRPRTFPAFFCFPLFIYSLLRDLGVFPS